MLCGHFANDVNSTLRSYIRTVATLKQNQNGDAVGGPHTLYSPVASGRVIVIRQLLGSSSLKPSDKRTWLGN